MIYIHIVKEYEIKQYSPCHRVPRIRQRESSLFCVLDLFEECGIKFVQMFWHQVWVHLNVRKTLRMSGEMNLEISFGSESVSTDVTFVRPLPRVRSKQEVSSDTGTDCNSNTTYCSSAVFRYIRGKWLLKTN